MNPPVTIPITIDDLCARKTREDGSYVYEFDQAKATKALSNKLTLVMVEGNNKIWRFSDQIYQDNGVGYIKDLIYSIAGNSVDRRAVNEVLDRIGSKLQLSPVTFNPNPCLLGVGNGVLNCETSKFRTYIKEDLITEKLPVRYDPAAQCPEILKFIDLNSVACATYNFPNRSYPSQCIGYFSH